MKNRYTAEELVEALKRAFCIKTIATPILGRSYETTNNYCERNKIVEQACREGRQRIIDIAEKNLVNDLMVKERCPTCFALFACKNCGTTIQFGKDWATRFVLSTLAKDRGFAEKKEHTFKISSSDNEKPNAILSHSSLEYKS
jgi:hypothetical protein